MKFKETHTWVKLDKEVATVGISNFAQKELGEIVYVELPKLGSQVKEGDEIVVLESTKAAIDIYTPLSGEVTEINPLLKENPGLINTSPEDQAWLYKIKISNIQEYEVLLDEESYRSLLALV